MCSHTCVQRNTSVCVFLAELPDGCYLPESDGQGEAGQACRSFEVLLTPGSSIRPEEIRHVVPPFRLLYGSAEGGKDICSYLPLTTQCVCVSNRPVKVTKKCVWPRRESPSSPLILSPVSGQK